jgi:glycosyltransferase involved in cell wall biosynthesis
MLAPPWIPVPPPAYGGIEAVVALLAGELVRRGHDVTLFAAPGSRSRARVAALLDRPHEGEIGKAMHEVDHVARAFARVDDAARQGEPYDVVHDHCGFAAFAMADRLSTPLVHTLHGPFVEQTAYFYAHHAAKAHVVAISRTQLEGAPPGLRLAGVVPNPIDADSWPLRREKERYLLWVGRMTEEKGPHRAIEAARLAGLPIVLAGPVQPGKEEFFAREVEPLLDGMTVTYAGEVSGETKAGLFSGAQALLMPIRWQEPFGMVMLEAMVCGTPVIAFPEGAARELVRPGETGFLVEDEREMARACRHLERIDPERCRASAVERCDVRRVGHAYEEIYATVADARGLAAAPATASPRVRGAQTPVGGRRSPEWQAARRLPT